MGKFDNYILGLEVNDKFVIDYEKVKAGGVRFLVVDAGMGEGAAINAAVGSVDPGLTRHVQGAYDHNLVCGATWRLQYEIEGHTLPAMIADQVPEFMRVLQHKSIGFMRFVVGDPIGITETNITAITTGVADLAEKEYLAKYGKTLPTVISIAPAYFRNKHIETSLAFRDSEVYQIAPAASPAPVPVTWTELRGMYPAEPYPVDGWPGRDPIFLYWSRYQYTLPGIYDKDGNPSQARLLFYTGTLESLWSKYGKNLKNAPDPVVISDGGTENPANVLLNIQPVSQVDPRWKDAQLGTSATTIGGYGCLVTSISMMLAYFGYDTDPLRLNELLKAKSGFSNGNLFVWGSLQTIFPAVSFGMRYDGARLDKIDEELAARRPVLIHVDYDPSTPPIDQHWVLIIGKMDGSYIINDPGDGQQLKFEDRYGDPRTKIYTVCTYQFDGIPPVVVPPVVVPPDQVNQGEVVNRLDAILERQDSMLIYLDSIQKLIEAHGPWRR